MVRQWQELFYDKRFSAVEFGYDVPDYVKLAEAYGAIGLRCETTGRGRGDDPKGERDRRPHGRHRLPRATPTEKCYPMVPAGASNDDIILGPEYEKDHADILHRHPGGDHLMAKHTLSVLVENKPGVLARVAGLVRAPRLQHRVARGRPDRDQPTSRG